MQFSLKAHATRGSQDDGGGGAQEESADQRQRSHEGLLGGGHAQPDVRLGPVEPAGAARVETQRQTGM